MLLQQQTLFGGTIDLFQSAKQRYGTWPLTVWHLNHQDNTFQELRTAIADEGQARRNCFTIATDDKSVYRGKVTESIFNPQAAIWLLNCYAPSAGICFDPFGGGGTRAILAAKHGLSYIGIECRKQEVDAVLRRCYANGVEKEVQIIHGDARQAGLWLDNNTADILLTCPPYWNLEQYDGGVTDLSMLPSYDDFLAALEDVISESFAILKSGAYALWVVGLHRDSSGNLLALNHDVAQIHQACGFTFKEEIILEHQNTGAIQRVGNFEKGRKYLVRIHEYALVFRKP